MRSFTFSIFVSLICASSSAENTCGIRQLDAKFSLLTRAIREVTWATNQLEMGERCRAFKINLAEAQKYTEKCSQGESKTLLTIALKAMWKSEIKKMCRIKVDQEKMIASSNCFNSGKENASIFWPQMITSITLAANWSDSSARLPLLCCSLIKWRDCFVKAYEGKGGPLCTEADIEYIDKYIHKAMMDPMRIFCSEYQFSDKCDKYEKIFHSMKTTMVEYLTPVPAILQLFKNLYSSPTLPSDSNMLNSSMSFKSDVILILIASCINLLYFTGIK